MSLEVISLSRGGYIIKTPCGCLQIGAPPETIKDSMSVLGEVPDTFVVPNKIFSVERGVSLADFEFPTYYNFFIKRRPVRIIGFDHQLKTCQHVVREALLGPEVINLVREYPYGINRDLIPNLRAEMEYLRADGLSGKRKAELSDMIIPISWGPNNRVPFGNMALERNKDVLKVVDGRNVLAEVPLDISFGANVPDVDSTKPFEPPLFGLTVIGSGSGFDTKELTSGFILWINKRGILVDPPVDSTKWLKTMDINPRLIDDCILSHCHADHDSGILQKLLEEKKINLYTTETVMESFIRKYQPLTGLTRSTFMSLFKFHPINLQVPIRINGGEFRFFYTLHSIPTIGFEVYFQGKSFVNSSDSMYDPQFFKKLQKKKERRAKAIEALARVGMADQLNKKPNQLSGGQMQRVAIARAIVNDPKIILADEPTGALDSELSVQVMDILAEIAENRLVIMVTHNPELAKQYCTRIVRFKDGSLIEDTNPYVSHAALEEELEENVDEEGNLLGVGKTQYSSKEAVALIGVKKKKPIIHYDYLYLE